jgi:energy-coupling factor transporter ATP-binding protein EcfA2
MGGERDLAISFQSVFGAWSPPLERTDLERLSARRGWEVVGARESFLVAPSVSTLADLLRQEAEAWRRQETMEWGWLPWIVEHCHLLAETPDQLLEVALRVEAGLFGDVEDWRAAERRWIDHGITPEDVAYWRHHALDRNIATIGMSLAWRDGSRPQHEVQEETRIAAVATLQELLHAALECSTAKVRRALMALTAGIAFWLIDARIQGAVEFPSARADLLCLARPPRVDLHLLTFIARASDDDPGWCAWLDRIAEEGRFESHQHAGPDFALRFSRWLSRWWDDPFRRPRVELLVVGLAERTDPPQDHPALREARAMKPREFTNPEAARGAFDAQYRNTSISTDELLERWYALRQRGIDASFWRSLYELSSHGVQRFAEFWRSLAPDDRAARAELLRALRAYQYRRAAALVRDGRWSWLRLPMPSPSELASITAPVPAVPAAPTPVPTRFEVTNFRGLRDLVIEAPSAREERGVTLLVLGRNGLGKTTLLRALALALVDPAVASGVLAQSPPPFRRDGCDAARCVVRTSEGEYAVTIQNGGEVERVVDPQPPEGPRPFVVAYGCRRGSALGSPVQRIDVSPASDIDNLFDQPLGLTNTEAGLAQLKAASNDRGDEAWQVYDHVREALKGLLPEVDAIEIRSDRRVWVTFKDPSLGDVRWSALSDGYLTTAGWAVDLMARWIERQTNRLKLPVKPGFREAMTGYALIDEIDLHLHPAWQTRVIADARRIFPRMNFIVTTHNPLTLVGARPGEVRVLVRDVDTGDVLAVDPTAGDPSSDPRLLTGTELYRTYFGIDDVHPDEAGRLLREYQYLAANPYRSDDEDALLAKMREDLAREGITPNIPPVAREAIPEDEA